MAHLLEHLLFKGSKAIHLNEEFTRRGARRNGTTSNDRTTISRLLASDDNLAWHRARSRRMLNSFVSKQDLDSEMSVCAHEFELGENNPAACCSSACSSAYPLAQLRQPIIGIARTSSGCRSTLQAFYRTWYQPETRC